MSRHDSQISAPEEGDLPSSKTDPPIPLQETFLEQQQAQLDTVVRLLPSGVQRRGSDFLAIWRDNEVWTG